MTVAAHRQIGRIASALAMLIIFNVNANELEVPAVFPGAPGNTAGTSSSFAFTLKIMSIASALAILPICLCAATVIACNLTAISAADRPRYNELVRRVRGAIRDRQEIAN